MGTQRMSFSRVCAMYEKLSKKLNTCSTPYVILDRAIHDIFHDYVAADHQLGGYLATDHLVSQRNGAQGGDGTVVVSHQGKIKGDGDAAFCGCTLYAQCNLVAEGKDCGDIFGEKVTIC